MWQIWVTSYAALSFAGTLRADAKTLHMKCSLHHDKQSGVTLCLRYSGSLNLEK